MASASSIFSFLACFVSSLAAYSYTDFKFDAGNGHAWVYGDGLSPYEARDFCAKIQKRQCSYSDLYVLWKERRNQCSFGFINTFGFIQDPDNKDSLLYLAYNVNVDTFSDQVCKHIGRINTDYISKGKVWCCKTHNPTLKGSYSNAQLNQQVCGHRVERTYTRWDGSIVSNFYQQRVCRVEDLQAEFINMGKSFQSGWAYDTENKFHLYRASGNSLGTFRDYVNKYRVYCCDRDSLNIGEKCNEHSDCSSWICKGVCLRAYGDYRQNIEFSLFNQESLDLLKTIIFFTLVSCLVLVFLIKASGWFCPARGFGICVCRCKRKQD